jgi:hypothetical protein
VIVTKASKISGTMGILALLITLFIVADVSAQSQYCECNDSVRTVAVRRAPVRRVARRTTARRSYRTARLRTVRRSVYVPTTRVASYVGYADTNDCDSVQTSRVVVTEPVYNETYDRVYTSSNVYNADAIARGWGRRDGFKDGWKAALKYRAYNVENNGDFRDANNGYKGRFGSKFLYKTSYRNGYAVGYDEGYRSVNGGERYGTIRY